MPNKYRICESKKDYLKARFTCAYSVPVNLTSRIILVSFFLYRIFKSFFEHLILCRFFKKKQNYGEAALPSFFPHKKHSFINAGIHAYPGNHHHNQHDGRDNHLEGPAGRGA